MINAAGSEDYALSQEEEDFLKKLYDGSGDKFDRASWLKNRDELAKGLLKGLGKVSTGYSDEDQIAQSMMEANINRFGFDKSLAEVYHLNQALKSPDVRTYNDFKKQAKSILGTINNTNLKTEYNFAVASSQEASSFIRAKKDGMKYGRYETVGDDHVRAEHQVLDGKVFRLNDPNAVKFVPPLGYNCRCTMNYLSSYDGDVSNYQNMADLVAPDKLQKMKDGGFLVNRADLKEVFTQNQFYTEKLLQNNDPNFKLTELTDLDHNLNGLDSYADIKKGKLPSAHVDPNATKEDAVSWFTGLMDGKRNVPLTDAMGRSLRLEERPFLKHLSDLKYLAENRAGLASLVPDVLKQADEVYMYEYKTGKYSYKYLKFFDSLLYVITAELNGNYGLRITSWYDGAQRWLNGKMQPVNVDKEVRRGLLVYLKK